MWLIFLSQDKEIGAGFFHVKPVHLIANVEMFVLFSLWDEGRSLERLVVAAIQVKLGD